MASSSRVILPKRRSCELVETRCRVCVFILHLTGLRARHATTVSRAQHRSVAMESTRGSQNSKYRKTAATGVAERSSDVPRLSLRTPFDLRQNRNDALATHGDYAEDSAAPASEVYPLR